LWFGTFESVPHGFGWSNQKVTCLGIFRAGLNGDLKPVADKSYLLLPEFLFWQTEIYFGTS
jgi:hypothetical protein